MITQGGLSLQDRIILRQLLTITLKEAEVVAIEKLSEEEQQALKHWWQTNNNQTDDQKLEDILKQIEQTYADKPDSLITDLQYTLGTDPIKDAFVDAALTKALVDDMRSDITANDASSKTGTTDDTKKIIDILIRRKMTEKMMDKVRENRQKDRELNSAATVAVERTDPKVPATPSASGSFTHVIAGLTPIVDSLAEQSGVGFSPVQKEVITVQLAAMAACGALDLSNAQELTVHFSTTASEVNHEYAAVNPIKTLYQNIDQVVRDATSGDLDQSLTAAAQNKSAQDQLKKLNQEIQQDLLNQTSPEVAKEESIRITKTIAQHLQDHPDATPAEIQKLINKEVQALTGNQSQTKVTDQTLKAIAQIDHNQIEVVRTTYAQQIITDVVTQSGAQLEAEQVKELAREIAQQSTYLRTTDTEAIAVLTHRLSTQTGVDEEKIKEHLETHIAQIQRLKQLNHSVTTVNIPAGIAIDTDKIQVKDEEEIKKALAKTLKNTKNLSPKDIDRILASKDIIDKAVQNLAQNQDFQLNVRRIDTSAIYSKEQNEIYKAFFQAYKDDLERSRPTQRGVETIVLISSLPHQTILSPTAVALASMGVTTEMFDQLIKDPSKSPDFQRLLKNHKSQLALLREQLEQLEGSKIHQELGPDRLKMFADIQKLSVRDAALVSLGGRQGKTLAEAYNKSVLALMGDLVAPRFIPFANIIFHPIDALKDYAAKRAGQALAKALLGGKTLAQAIGKLLVQGLAKIGINVALGAATAGVGLVLSFLAEKLIKPFTDIAKDLFGEDIKLRDVLLAPVVVAGTLFSGIASLVSVSSILSSGLLATMGSSILLGLFIYITSFVMAPILSTIAHLESGALGTATQPYTGAIIEGCNPIWPMTPARPYGRVIQGPRGPYSHSRVEGIDITSAVGTQVVSISHGTIVFNDYYGVYGNLVRIQSVSPSGSSYEVWYGHLAAPSPLGVGDDVKIGDPIALSGATSSNANFANPHLHLEYRNMNYNQCPAGGVQIPSGCYGFTDCGSVSLN